MKPDITKTDFRTGESVHEHLTALGIETPFFRDTPAPDVQQVEIQSRVSQIMQLLGLDLGDDSLCETPKRIAKMYLNELFYGLNYGNFPKVTMIENKMQYSTMLMERHISIKSTCEHHLLPFIGEAFIAYIPSEKVIGLSKINRIVDFFCRRPQVQERLTEQIFATLQFLLGTDDVAVFIKARHTCVVLRGVEDTNADTVTARLGGSFLTNDKLRNEFYQSIQL